LRSIERVRVVECVAGLVTEVHHDLPRVFDIVHLRLEALQFRIGKIERNSDDGFHAGAAPLISEVALGAKAFESLGLELFVELLNESLEWGAFQFEAELLNRLGEDFLDFDRCFFEICHSWTKRSTGTGGSAACLQRGKLFLPLRLGSDWIWAAAKVGLGGEVRLKGDELGGIAKQ